MDAAGEVMWRATLARAGEHDKAVFSAHDTVLEPEVESYWVDWNGFKASLKALNDEIQSTFSIVLNSEIEAKEADLNLLIARFNNLGLRIQARKLDLAADLLLAALAKQKKGLPLTDEEITLIARYKAEGEKPLIRDSPVAPTPLGSGKTPGGGGLSLPWTVGLAAAGTLVLVGILGTWLSKPSPVVVLAGTAPSRS